MLHFKVTCVYIRIPALNMLKSTTQKVILVIDKASKMCTCHKLRQKEHGCLLEERKPCQN